MSTQTSQIKCLDDLFAHARQDPKNPLWKYERIREKIEKNKFFLSWKWPAFFCGPIWLFYRKMYAVGFLYLLISYSIDALLLFSIYANYVIVSSSDHIFVNSHLTSFFNYVYDHLKILQNLSIFISFCILALIGNWCYGRKLGSYIGNEISSDIKFTSKLSAVIYLLAQIAIPILFLLFFRSFILK